MAELGLMILIIFPTSQVGMFRSMERTKKDDANGEGKR
jgi:hypothetical protein